MTWVCNYCQLISSGERTKYVPRALHFIMLRMTNPDLFIWNVFPHGFTLTGLCCMCNSRVCAFLRMISVLRIRCISFLENTVDYTVENQWSIHGPTFQCKGGKTEEWSCSISLYNRSPNTELFHLIGDWGLHSILDLKCFSESASRQKRSKSDAVQSFHIV